MGYTRKPLRGFRKFAKVFWDDPSDGTIYGSTQVDVTVARRFQEDVRDKHGVYPSMAQLVGRGVAVALTETPDFNAKLMWGRTYVKDTVDVYFQVDVDDGADLSGVTVADAGRKTAVQVSQELTAYAERLRKGKDEQYEKTQKGLLGRMIPVFLLRLVLKMLLFCEYNLGWTPRFLGARPEPFGTVMITNVSKFGIDIAYAPLIKLSRVPFIVLVGQVRDRAWVVDGGRIEPRPIITLNASFDHRMGDGNKIGRIVRRVVAYIENPYEYEPGLGLTPPPGLVAASGRQEPAPAPPPPRSPDTASAPRPAPAGDGPPAVPSFKR